MIIWGLNEFISGLGHLGGNRSRGLGNCAMQLDRVYTANLTKFEELQQYLLHTDLDQKMTVKTEEKEIETFLETSVKALLEMKK